MNIKTNECNMLKGLEPDKDSAVHTWGETLFKFSNKHNGNIIKHCGKRPLLAIIHRCSHRNPNTILIMTEF